MSKQCDNNIQQLISFYGIYNFNVCYRLEADFNYISRSSKYVHGFTNISNWVALINDSIVKYRIT